jgi:hypothetical protein
VACNEAWIPAKAGRYASIEKGPSVDSAARSAAKRQRKLFERTEGVRRVAAGTEEASILRGLAASPG